MTMSKVPSTKSHPSPIAKRTPALTSRREWPWPGISIRESTTSLSIGSRSWTTPNSGSESHLEIISRPFIKKPKSEIRPLEVAILLGGHPALMLAAASRLPLDQDELRLAGAFLGEPVRLRQCKKIDLEVPTGIDFVIEGAFFPMSERKKGPLEIFSAIMSLF